MRLIKPLALRLAQTRYIQGAIRDRADLSVFKARPSARLLIGVGLIGVAQLMGLPAVAGFGAAAAVLGDPLVLIWGPASYIVSWGVWALGMWLAGPDNIMYAKAFVRWASRAAVERILGDDLDRADKEGQG